jgi:hypothetical protein
LPGEHARHVVEVAEAVDRELLVQAHEPGLVGEQLADRDALLAVLRELGPVARDGRVVVEVASRVGDRDRHRGDALGGGMDDDHRVFFPRGIARG